MITQWIYKTLIAFISVRILKFVFNDLLEIYKFDNSKSISKLRAIINTILLSMIPCIRWIMVVMVFFLVLYSPIYKKFSDKN